MKKIIVVGATSAIAKATARRFAGDGDSLYLLSRDSVSLEILARDLKLRGAHSVATGQFDARQFSEHEACVSEAFLGLGEVDIVLMAHGSLPDQKACEENAELALAEIEVNATGSISLLGHIAPRMRSQGHGSIVVITSVAGDRGRQSNYIYGAAKSMVSTYLQGLRNSLYGAGVNVIDIKPGFVDTPMTSAFSKGPLWSSPETIANCIVGAVKRGKNVVYAPFFWRYIMWIIKLIPEGVFKRLSL